VDDIPSRLQSSEHSDHFHRAGSHNTHQVRIFHPEFPGDLVVRPFHLARRIQTRTLADAEQQKEQCVYFKLFAFIQGYYTPLCVTPLRSYKPM
jgi:hypothetical protein